jgi:GT2 family glycosyltransferase/SAM-dependent methyltransferase
MSSQLRTAAAHPSKAANVTFLRAAPDLDSILDFDQWQRYSVVARFIDRLCAGFPGPIRVLDVGCNVLNLLPCFLDSERVQIIRCDSLPNDTGDSDYVRIEPNKPLPFDDGSFDAVAALEVLEHVPRDRREFFLADCLRVARRGAVFTCPNGTTAVAAAEKRAADAYQERHGQPHPFLSEHHEFGLPSEAEVRTILERLDVPHAVIPNAPLDVWLASIVLSEQLLEKAHDPDVRRELVRAFQDLPSSVHEHYRNIYVCAKSFEASGALNRSSAPLPRVGGEGIGMKGFETGDSLNHLAAAAERVLAVREFQHRVEPATLRAIIEEQQKGLNEHVQRFLILESYAAALERSGFWQMLAPLRWLRQNLRPRGFAAADLLPWKGLEPVADEPGAWTSLDADPQFLVSCWLPAGWVRIRFAIHAPDRTYLELYAEHGGGFPPDARLGQFALAAGRTEEEVFVKLDRPTRALRIDPIAMAGEFRVDRLDVTPRPAPVAVIDALRRKLRLLRAYRNTGPVLQRGLKLLVTGRWGQVVNKWGLGLHDPRCARHGHVEPQKAYERWMENHKLTDADRAAQRAWAEDLQDPPRISILMPTYNTAERYLRLAIESVLRQTYPHWELCIADDGSTQPHVRQVLAEYAAQDHRIKVTPPRANGGISAATNAALALATGDFVALLDHDDEIAEHALFRMAKAIVADPGADMLYSDEDKLQPDGLRVRPFFKPDWSPEYFLGCMYTCHLGLYRTSLVREIGGFRPALDGAQDYDMVLRLIERTDQIVHVPDVLYHWRLLPQSTAAGVAAKPHAHAAGLRALQEHLARTGRDGAASVGPSAGLNFVRFAVIGQPTVSIIIPSLCQPGDGKQSMLERCITSIVRGSRYKKFEILVLDRNQMPADMESRLKQLGVRRVTYDFDFNWSRVNNFAAEHSTGDHLLFLNDDTEALTPDWLEGMLEFSQQPEIGAVGAKLLFPDGGLQHVGVTVLDGKPGHPFYGYPVEHPGYYCRNVLPHNCAAVTGACLMTRREVFDEIGGFDDAFPLNYNDVDYCMKVRKLAYRIVFTPHARLMHHESVTKPGVFAEELDAFLARWGDAPDPYYNPNLNPETFDYRIGE